MDILKRSLAPISDGAWNEIEEEAERILKGNLSARGIVDFDGPGGWKKAAINLGSLKLGKKTPVKGIEWGTREVLPLLELRVPFSLDIWDLDNLERGGQAPNLDPVAEAAQKTAQFEEAAVYLGLPEAGFKGICETAATVGLPGDTGGLIPAFEDAILALQQQGVAGPYQLVLGTQVYRDVMAGDDKGYPLARRVKELFGGDFKWSPAIEGGVVLSRRGGDFLFTCGQDLSIGYHRHDAKKVDLFITESFAFQVLEPAAAVVLKQ